MVGGMSAVPPPRPPAPPSSHPAGGAVPPPSATAAPQQGHGDGGFRPDDIGPKKRWIWVSVALFVFGVAAAVAIGILGIVGISDQIDDFERVPRGSGIIEIDEEREFVVYSEEGTGFARVTIVDP